MALRAEGRAPPNPTAASAVSARHTDPSGRPPLITPGPNDGTWVTHEAAYTPEQIVEWQLDEWRACAEDPFRFVTRWCYAVDLHTEDGGGSTVSLIPAWPHVRAIVAALCRTFLGV